VLGHPSAEKLVSAGRRGRQTIRQDLTDEQVDQLRQATVPA
jgi:hypothetical protein